MWCMFLTKSIMEKAQSKYRGKAEEYINNTHKTKSLLKKALGMGKKKKVSLGESWEYLQLFIELIRAYSQGEYRQVSKSTIVTVIGSILYFISPIDLIPDFIAGIGLMDDAAVIGFTIKKVSKELDAFKVWKEKTITVKNPLE